MNKAKYDALPDDLRAILDAESGAKLSAFAAEVMLAADKPAREVAVAAGKNIIELDEAEVARWKQASRPVVARWVTEMGAQGIDGQGLIDQAKALIAEKSN